MSMKFVIKILHTSRGCPRCWAKKKFGMGTLFRGPLTPGVHPGGRNIAYDLALVKLGPHTKFGEDWSNGLAVHWIQTDRQLDKYILDLK
jgi:hypothetical protein